VKRHRTPLAGTVSAEPDEFTRPRVGAQQPRSQSSGFCDQRGTQRSGVAVDQLRVEPRPGVVAVTLMPVSAGEARRCTRSDERADRHSAPLERHRKVRSVVPEVARELHGRCSTLHQDHGDIGGSRAVARGDIFVGEGFPHPMRRAAVGDVQGLDPRRLGRWGVVDQERAELREQHPRFLSGRADAVGDDVEGGAAEAGAHPCEQQLDPRRGG
jgi:hypothetical protein